MQNKQDFLDRKTIIAIALLIVSWLAWDQYMKKKYPTTKKQTFVQTEKQELKDKETEDSKIKKLVNKSEKKVKTNFQKEKTLNFKGEELDLVFSSKGLGLKEVRLKNYYDRQKNPVVFGNTVQPLFSSFFLKSSEPIPFKIKREGNLVIGTFSSSEGKITKTIELDEKKFVLKTHIKIEGLKNKQLEGLSLMLSHPLPKEKESSSFFKMFLIYGQETLKGYVSYEGKEEERFTAKNLEEPQKFSQLNTIAFGNKYFGKAFINKASYFPSVYLEKKEKQAQARINYEFLHFKDQTLEYQIFIGPKALSNLQELGGGIKNWLDFGFFGWLARPLLHFLNWLYLLLSNWGLAIIFLTFFIRLALLPINIKSYQSMKAMQKIQPQMKELKERHKSDPKKMNLEVMALMKKNKANPLGGCLPLFIQFPVFFALYRVLGESLELYQAPFVFWIQDLSLKDPYFVLPIAGGLVLFLQQRITPMSLPKEQARLLTIMPLLFSVFMLNLPSGLTLYIFVSGVFGVIQQLFFVKLGQTHTNLEGGKNVKLI